RHPGVRQAIVMASPDDSEGARLIAYVVCDATPPVHSELRQRMGRALPDYMIPRAIVILAALPLTPNGKVDRRALPRPDRAAFDVHSVVLPRTPTEQTLAEAWRELLHVEDVGIHDNF